MEKWEYAFGTSDWRAYPDPEWQAESEPGSYADAEVALVRALAADDPASDYSLREPCIVRRSDRHPRWQPVKDHAAELLAEVLAEVAQYGHRTHTNVIQGTDLKHLFGEMARALDPGRTETNQEFD